MAKELPQNIFISGWNLIGHIPCIRLLMLTGFGLMAILGNTWQAFQGDQYRGFACRRTSNTSNAFSLLKKDGYRTSYLWRWTFAWTTSIHKQSQIRLQGCIKGRCNNMEEVLPQYNLCNVINLWRFFAGSAGNHGHESADVTEWYCIFQGAMRGYSCLFQHQWSCWFCK